LRPVGRSDATSGSYDRRGSEVDDLRTIGFSVLDRLDEMFLYDMNLGVTIRHWNYRTDPPRVVPAGDLALRSLTIVERSHVLVAIFGRELPSITQQEIIRAFERRRDGETLPIIVFLDPTKKTVEHDRFFSRIKADFGEEISYTPYQTPLDFQSLLFKAVIPIMLKLVGFRPPRLR